jgi:hypothetical protein
MGRPSAAAGTGMEESKLPSVFLQHGRPLGVVQFGGRSFKCRGFFTFIGGAASSARRKPLNFLGGMSSQAMR